MRKPKGSLKSAIEQAFEFQRLIDGKVVNNRAEVAERYGISRARVTQLMNLLELPRAVIDLLLRTKDGGAPRYGERQLRRVAMLRSPEDQIAAFEELQARMDSQPT